MIQVDKLDCGWTLWSVQRAFLGGGRLRLFHDCHEPRGAGSCMCIS